MLGCGDAAMEDWPAARRVAPAVEFACGRPALPREPAVAAVSGSRLGLLQGIEPAGVPDWEILPTVGTTEPTVGTTEAESSVRTGSGRALLCAVEAEPA
jgi:hypothetical protein